MRDPFFFAMLNTLPQPIIFAHRGASAHAPENTLAAFELALEQGADGIELDVKLSADGQVIVIHDATVDRTTDGMGPVSELTLGELRGLSAGYSQRFAGAFEDEIEMAVVNPHWDIYGRDEELWSDLRGDRAVETADSSMDLFSLDFD